MNFEDMRYMLVINEQKSITKAAQILFISQPTLSQRLQKVEAELNTKLFERNKFGELKPTQAGVIFCTESELILSHWQILNDQIRSVKDKRSYTLGIPVRTGYRLIEGFISRLSADYPDIQISFVDKANYILEEMVAHGELDMAMVRMATPNNNYIIRNIYHAKPMIRLRENSPLLDKSYYKEGDPVPYLDLNFLINEPMVATPSPLEHRTRLFIDQVLGKIPKYNFKNLICVPHLSICEIYAQDGIASYIVPETFDELKCNVYKLESKYHSDYSLDFIQSKTADPKDMDIIFSILNSLNRDKENFLYNK